MNLLSIVDFFFGLLSLDRYFPCIIYNIYLLFFFLCICYSTYLHQADCYHATLSMVVCKGGKGEFYLEK